MTVAQLVEFAHQKGASDIHFTSYQPPVLRCDGEMRPLPAEFALDHYEQELLALLPERLSTEFQRGEDADFAGQFGDVRCRINLFRQMGSLGCVMRLLADTIPTLDELGMPPVMKTLAMLPRGLVLLTGPTGSGKSTTLAAMVDYANERRRRHIITIEDPVEYVHHAKKCVVNQREVGRDVVSFAAALRSALREDPDIILVGEMRDFETISAALTAAETGHLVLSTLHTTGAARTIDRIIDVFPAHQQEQIRIQLAGVLRGVITQQLVRRVMGGRMAAMEVLVGTPNVSNMIREGKTHQIDSAIQTGLRDGMQLLDRCLGELVSRGEITMEEALEKCQSEEELRRFTGMR